MLAVLYWTVDTGQWTLDGTARDSGRAVLYWTEAARDSGRAVLYWTEAARDSGHGVWTVDGTEWTEVLSLL